MPAIAADIVNTLGLNKDRDRDRDRDTHVTFVKIKRKIKRNKIAETAISFAYSPHLSSPHLTIPKHSLAENALVTHTHANIFTSKAYCNPQQQAVAVEKYKLTHTHMQTRARNTP